MPNGVTTAIRVYLNQRVMNKIFYPKLSINRSVWVFDRNTVKKGDFLKSPFFYTFAFIKQKNWEEFLP